MTRFVSSEGELAAMLAGNPDLKARNPGLALAASAGITPVPACRGRGGLDIGPHMSPDMVRQIAMALNPDPEITHEEFDQLFYKIAHAFRWKAAHFRPAYTGRGYRTPVSGDGEGFLDWTLARDRMMAVELKTKKDDVRPKQQEWVSAWQRAKVEVHVWWPKDWSEIVKVLAK